MEQLILLILKTTDNVHPTSKRKVSLDSILQRIGKISASNLVNKTLRLELDQMVIKGSIDQIICKILNMERIHLNKIRLPGKVNFTFPEKRGDKTEGNLY